MMNPMTRSALAALYVGSKRSALMAMLGGKCSCKGDNCYHDGECGITDKRCLQIDHKNGGGCKELRTYGGNAQMVSYYLNHPDEARDRLQVLCANCNWVKRSTHNEVAHANDDHTIPEWARYKGDDV